MAEPAGTRASIEQVYAPDRMAWRAWLEQNHATAAGVWLVYYKKQSGKPRVAYEEAVEEALCFGWIDSRPNRIDDERYAQLFSPRKPRSPWSRINKRRVEELIRRGAIAPAGLAVVEEAKRDGSWDAYDEIEDLRVPDDLRAALQVDRQAEEHFDAFGASAKKQILWWIASAKRDQTRQDRIARIVAAAHENSNPLAYRRTGGS